MLHRFLDNKKIEHSREHFFPLPGQSVLWSGGEFLCPLCQCFGNTVLPMLPQVGQLSVLGHSAQPQRNVSMLEWRAMVTKAMILAQRGEVTAAGKMFSKIILASCVLDLSPVATCSLEMF